MELNARVEIAIYEGVPIDKEFYAQHLKGIKSAYIERILGYRCDTAWMVGRMALSEAIRDPSQKRVARKSIARLLSCKTAYTRILARMLGATLAVQDRDVETAVRYFREAVTLADETHILFVAAAARRRLGALIGGDEGRALVATSERWMKGAGIKDFDRMTRLASPCSLEVPAR
jgi:hypothetical protein